MNKRLRRSDTSRTDGIILDRGQLRTVQPDSFRGVKETSLGGRDQSNDDRSVRQSYSAVHVKRAVRNVPCLSTFCHLVRVVFPSSKNRGWSVTRR